MDQDQERVLAVLYELAGGDVTVRVRKEQVMTRVAETGILDMTEVEFEVWKRNMIRAVAARRGVAS